MSPELSVVRIPEPIGADWDALKDPPGWLPVLAFSETFDESAYGAARSAFGDVHKPDWPGFVAWCLDAELAELESEDPDVLRLNPEWLPVLQEQAQELLVEPKAWKKLIAACSTERDWHAATALVLWVRSLERWPVMPDIWRAHAERAESVPEEFLTVFAELPAEARAAQPVLTWMSAIAAAETVTPSAKRTEVFLDRVILDSALLHADWQSRESTDLAVEEGVLRMVGQRYLPPSGDPLDAAWRTKVQLDEFVDARSRTGQPPTPQVHAYHRLMSARLSMMRADLTGAVAEAHWGGVLAVVEAVSNLSIAIEHFARSLAGQVRDSEELARGPVRPPGSYRFGSIGQGAVVVEALARARECLQILDRDGLKNALGSVSPELAAVAGVWAGRVGLEAIGAAIWADPASGLNRLMAAMADQPIGAREQDEPMGGMMLGRARSLLLCRLGAFEAAAAALDTIPVDLQALPRARTLLWAGRFGQAVRTMDLALPDPNLMHSDRLQLMMIRGAATSLEGSLTGDIADDTVNAVRQLLLARSYLGFATLPGRARKAILEISSSLASNPETAERYAELVERLSRIADTAAPLQVVKLTERESVLLPLLAADESIPALAARLHVSVNTLRKQVAVLREKFQASTRAELVRKAASFGALRKD